jgi:isopentenyl diphosphate isomerase/L-lactate dehydrogenase-like FMN-dependent dehydrogenase
MGMRKVTLRELSSDVQKFLAQAKNGEGLMVEDENGRARYGVIPFVEATAEEKGRAWKELQKLQRQVGKAMTEQGVTDEDVERELLKDD